MVNRIKMLQQQLGAVSATAKQAGVGYDSVFY